MTQCGIIIANTGSPAAPTPDAVREYLSRFLTDPRIRPLPPILWNVILRHCILPHRSVFSAKKYGRIWTEQGSPLDVTMESLAEELQRALDQRQRGAFAVQHAMSYGTPSMKDAIEQLRDGGCTEIVVIPLYPQGAFSTAKAVEDKARDALGRSGWDVPLRFIEDYASEDAYVTAIAESITAAGFDAARDKLLMAFHSVPMKDIRAGDRYGDMVAETGERVAEQLGVSQERWRIGFQCRFDKSRKWLSPFAPQAMAELMSDGNGRLFVVTPNFSIDCLETLHDVQINLRERFHEDNPDAAEDDFVYVPCLNDSPAHVALLTNLVRH